MIQRWVSAALLEAEMNFRRVRGYRDMRHLIVVLDALTPPITEKLKGSYADNTLRQHEIVNSW